MDIAAVRKSLEEQREILKERAARIHRHTRHRDEPLPADFADQAQELENEEVLSALDDSTSDQLRAIEKAIARMDADTYGICAACGNAIDESRLEVHPTAERCISCA